VSYCLGILTVKLCFYIHIFERSSASKVKISKRSFCDFLSSRFYYSEASKNGRLGRDKKVAFPKNWHLEESGCQLRNVLFYPLDSLTGLFNSPIPSIQVFMSSPGVK